MRRKLLFELIAQDSKHTAMKQSFEIKPVIYANLYGCCGIR